MKKYKQYINLDKNTVIEKINSFLEEDLPNGKKVFTSFELLEHLVNPSKFIKNTRNILYNTMYFSLN